MFTLLKPRVVQKCLKIFRLSFSEYSSLPDLKNLNVVRTVEKVIENNTKIFIESPIHVKVQPIDVNDINAHDKLTMILYSRGKDSSDLQVKQSSKRLELVNKNISSDKNDVCVIKVPYHAKVQVSTSDTASVEMEKLEGEEFVVKSEKGSVRVKDLKAQNITVESLQGEIFSEGKLQASFIEFKTGATSGIHCNNIMSNNFSVTTHAGPITVKSCYSEKSHFTTLMGDITLEYMHGSVKIEVIQYSNLKMSSFDGDVHASLKSGEVFMHVALLTKKSSIFIHEKGRVELLILNIAQNLPSTNLIADKLMVCQKVLKMGRLMDDSHPKRFRFEKEPQNELRVVCKNGSIELKETDFPFKM